MVTNEHPERICLYLVREFDDEPSKIGHFQITKSMFGAKCDLIFLRQKFLFEYQIRRITFIKSIYLFNHSCKTLFSKNVPYFCQLCLKLSYKIQINPFRMFIRVQICIEFHLPPYKIPQPCSYHRISVSTDNFCRKYCLKHPDKKPNVVTDMKTTHE